MVDSVTNVTYTYLIGIEPAPIFALMMMWGLMSSDVGLTYYGQIVHNRLLKLNIINGGRAGGCFSFN